MLIRAATASDLAGVVDVHVASWDAAKDGLDLVTRRTPEQRTELWTAFFAQGRGQMFVAEDQGRVVGFMAFGPSRDDDRQGQTEIYTLYVDPAWWRQGIGSSLMDQVSDTGGPLSVWTSEGSAQARGFYARHGFHPDGATEAGHHLPQVRLVRSERPSPAPEATEGP
ncbi:MAG: GNAT family N-acetyltransferase [Candidatus Nanopelagicales bacterium]